MSQTSALEVNGDLVSHPIAELIVEIADAALSGSLRLSSGDRKAIVYFTEGAVALAVSNERRFRLADALVNLTASGRASVATQRRAASDVELVDRLVEAGHLSREQGDEALRSQCARIIESALAWPDGEWSFSPLARLRSDIDLDLDAAGLLVAFARRMNVDVINGRFRDPDERLTARERPAYFGELQPHEAAVMTRIAAGVVRLDDIIRHCDIPRIGVLQALYALWLGGFVRRCGWPAAFTDIKIAAIRSAGLAKVKGPARPKPAARPPEPDVESPVTEAAAPEPAAAITLDEYLSRAEAAESLYDVLGVKRSARTTEIRSAYFALAKQFHPDRFHRVEPELRRRVENAFTEIAQAYETLRDEQARAAYDKRLAQQEKDKDLLRSAGARDDAARPAEEARASEDFERGFALQLRGDFESALPFLARAAYYAPRNARYRAFYGKALSYDESQRHKAEHELQAAARLDPDNPAIRLMLAEFFVKVKLLKRAEGELNRLLARDPQNREARALLDSLQRN
ncbi:MAG: DnaJ domain-containing protein [Pyrinomonadaceae bacterium]